MSSTPNHNELVIDLEDDPLSASPLRRESALQSVQNCEYSIPYQHEPLPIIPSLNTHPTNTVASSVMDTINSQPTAAQVKDNIVNGPIGQAVQDEKAKTSNEFKDLADSKTIPATPAATGQPLTQYHSLFYRLLSWKNPRATAITYGTVIAVIFASRYFNALSWTFRALYTVLGVTALSEVVGKAALGTGFATQLRPKKYYTISKDSLERFLDDLEQLINFLVIEFQRILFAENIWVTSAAFVASFLSYWLIKWLPLWGLSLIAANFAFLGPLIYVQNKDLIDGHINNAGEVINAQAAQVRDLAAQHTTRATETVRSYAGEYSQKAQDMLGSARGKATNGSVKSSDLPTAPKSEPLPNAPSSVPVTAQPVQ